MPVEIAPGDGEYLKRSGSAAVGADAAQLAADVDTAGVFLRQDALDDDTAALVEDSESAVKAALDAQYVTTAALDVTAIRVEESDPGDLADGELLIVAPPFSPLDIAGCQAWFDAQSIEGLSDSDPITTWADLSGFGRDAAEGSGAGTDSAGSYDEDGLNGLPAVALDGSDALTTGAFGVTLSTSTLFAVAQGSGFTATRTIIDGIGASNRNMLFYSGSASGFATYAGSTVGSATANTNPHIFCGVINGASSAFRIDGTEQATGDAGSQTLTGLSIGARYDTNAQWWQGTIGEIIVFGRALSAAEIAQVEAYLAARWGF